MRRSMTRRPELAKPAALEAEIRKSLQCATTCTSLMDPEHAQAAQEEAQRHPP